MEYLEAVLIKRHVRPDNLPTNLAHLPAEADRVIRLHKAICESSDSVLPLQLPELPAFHRERVNAVLLYHLMLACGRLEAWGGPKEPLRVNPDKHSLPETRPTRSGRPARPGGSAAVLDWVE